MPRNPYPFKTVEETEQIRDQEAFIVHSSLLTLTGGHTMLRLRATDVVGREVKERMRAKWFPALEVGDVDTFPAILPAWKSLHGEGAGPPPDVTLALAADVTVSQASRVGRILKQIASIDLNGDSPSGSRSTGLELLMFGLRMLTVLELFVLACRFELYGVNCAGSPTIAAALKMTSEEVDELERQMLGRLVHPIMSRKLCHEGRRQDPGVPPFVEAPEVERQGTLAVA